MSCTQRTTRRHFVRQLLAVAGVGTLTAGRVYAAVVKRPLPVVNLDFLPAQLSIRRRSCWTDSSPHAWQLREAEPFSRVTVHHQGAGVAHAAPENAVVADIDAIFGGHRRLGYADIGYHFIVDYNGRLWEGRSLAYAGAHVAGKNDDNIGILALGNYNRQKPSSATIRTIKTLTSALQNKFLIKPDHVYGHRELGASDCPGDYLFKRVVDMRNAFIADITA